MKPDWPLPITGFQAYDTWGYNYKKKEMYYLKKTQINRCLARLWWEETWFNEDVMNPYAPSEYLKWLRAWGRNKLYLRAYLLGYRFIQCRNAGDILKRVRKAI